MRALLTIGIVVTLLVAPAFSYAQERTSSQPVAQAPNLVGIYEYEGTNPDGSAYKGFVEIASVQGTFRVLWTMDDGYVLGIGIYSNGVFAVSYFAGAPAIVVYKVEGNRLIGEWTMGGDAEGKTYTEVLTKTDKRPEQRPAPQRPPAPSNPPHRI